MMNWNGRLRSFQYQPVQTLIIVIHMFHADSQCQNDSLLCQWITLAGNNHRFLLASSLTVITITLSWVVIFFADTSSIPSPPSLFAGLVAAPIIETIAFQALPYAAIRFIGITTSMPAVAAMSIPFALAHLERGPLVIIGALIGGMLYGFTFFLIAQKSRKNATMTIILAHAMHNAVVLLLIHIT